MALRKEFVVQGIYFSLQIYIRLVGSRIRGQMEYRASFLLQLLSAFAVTFTELLAILILFQTFGEMAGWNAGEVMFLYGMVSIAFGLTEMVSGGFDNASLLVRTGEYDRLLTRPVPVTVQVLASDFQLRRIGRIVQAVFAIMLAQAWVGIEWTLPKLVVLVSGVLSTSIVFFTVLIIGAAACFWTVESSEAQNVFTYGGVELGSFPFDIYPRYVKASFLYLVPLALTSYYPTLYVLGKTDSLGLPFWLRFTAPLVAALFLGVGLFVWRLGLRHYQSTGS